MEDEFIFPVGLQGAFWDAEYGEFGEWKGGGEDRKSVV